MLIYHIYFNKHFLFLLNTPIPIPIPKIENLFFATETQIHDSTNTCLRLKFETFSLLTLTRSFSFISRFCMGQNRVQKKEKQQSKRNNFDDKHNSKHVRTKQAILAKRQQARGDNANSNTNPKTKSKGKPKKHK